MLIILHMFRVIKNSEDKFPHSQVLDGFIGEKKAVNSISIFESGGLLEVVIYRKQL